MLIIQLKEKKELPVLKGHPWIFSGAIDKVQGNIQDTTLCRVIDSKGRFICQGFYSPFSQIAVRVLSRGKESINRAFFHKKLSQALAMRSKLITDTTSCYRLVHGEGDGIPGLNVDIYKDVLVMQFLCSGMEEFKGDIVDIFHEIYPASMIHERSDIRSRSTEGLRPVSGPLHGELKNGEVVVSESGHWFVVDILTGERTGFYLDRRLTRQRLQSLAKDKDVLDLFSYTGAFSVYALAGGAKSVVSVDSASPAQALLKKNMEINKIKPFAWNHIRNDVFRFLAQENKKYDIVVCDPASFIKDFEEYTKINTLAMERLNPGGFLFSIASLTSQFSHVDLLKSLTKASLKVSRDTHILEPIYQSPDFPVLPSHAQGAHLCGYIVYVE